jgi:ATP-binding cassette subfamily B protein
MLLEGGLVAMIIRGSVLLRDDMIGVQQFVLAIILGGIFSASFAKLATFQHYRVVFDQSMTRIGSVLNSNPPQRNNLYKAVPPGDIMIQDLDFSYHEGEKALSQIDLTFSQNNVHAIVGSSGSGKSTLAHLLMGFWRPQKGSISIGGVDIADMTEEALSQLVSIVQQDVFLFNLSIEENIRMGKADATKEEVIDAAKRAQIHDFIMTLPHAYDTLAGEGGVKFSGGEKQRLSLARMILKDAPIVILDEATAAIDPSNERLIQKAMTQLGQDKTIITIAHHLHTITHADQIVVMDSGMVVATGAHDELMNQCDEYINMVEQQDNVDNWQIKERI